MKKFVVSFGYFLLMLVEWVFDLVVKLVSVVHSEIRELTIAIEKKYNQINEPDSGKE